MYVYKHTTKCVIDNLGVKSNKSIKLKELIYTCHLVSTSDLARLYQCQKGIKTINQAVSRYRDRFPEDFYFRLNEEENNSLRSQLRALKNGRGNHPKYLSYAFTEQGVAMLATILRTEIVSQMSVAIMRAFVAMRHYIENNEYRLSNVEEKIIEHSSKIRLLQESFNKFEEKRKVNEIYFEGQIFDAYYKINEICKLLIDKINYIIKNDIFKISFF